MAIYLVRHGKDEDGYRGGWSDRGLIDEGIRQSEKLAQYLWDNRSLYKIKSLNCPSSVRRIGGKLTMVYWLECRMK
ncbi:phosphoglycerate mutase family protein [Paenibacillus sp. J2TS4]|uniref:phosphoglycerate mutase family protein n=1 Tax=Paenibacillus sp. J2TS4 TaxID=2807194 RepID=UPI001B0B39D0|nr:phosphoglycerate mutase family protein [Paenibacillus sp. J2TS4]GIP31977.1 hypothetical protein J2TS4_11870 [Paenibacillus sp. J2TS4]